MGTSWATGAWATQSWAANTWAALGDVMETLALGDLTTAVAAWFLTLTGADRNTDIRDRLATNYSVPDQDVNPADVTTLFSRFLQNRA